MDVKMIRFLKERHLLSLATASNNAPYCSSLFFVFIEEELMLVVSSSDKTKHIREAVMQTRVAGTITGEAEDVNRIRGIQFTGDFEKLSGKLLEKAKHAYLSAFPVARFVAADIYGIRLTWVKMTDNRLGFGKKLTWEKSNLMGCR